MHPVKHVSSVQFSLPGLTCCCVQALQDHKTAINVFHAVVAGTEKFSEVAGMKRETARRWQWAVTRSMPELLRPEMRGRQVRTCVWQEPRRRCWRPNAVSGKNKSRTRAWSPLRNIQGRDHEDSDIPGRIVWNSRVLAQTASEAAAAAVSRGRIDGRRGSVALPLTSSALSD